MISTEELTRIKRKLSELDDALFIAKTTLDKRKREKNLNDISRAIADYAHNLPDEVIVYLEKIGANVLHFQHAQDDIDRCIKAIDELISRSSKD